MKTRHALKASLLAASTLYLLSFGTSAHAQLRIDFSQPTLTGSNGNTLSFSGLLTNLGREDVLIAGDTFSLNGTGLTLDDTSFLLTFPETLAAGKSAQGQFFTVMLGLSPPVAAGLYTGTFTVSGEGVTTGGGYETTASFNVVAAPEPATLGLALTCLLACGGTALHKRRTRLHTR